MLSKFRQNSVMHGCIDYFCLACEAMLRSEEEVHSHIDKAAHKNNLDKTSYVQSCYEDRIRKVKKWYYCECCNILLANIIKMNIHIKEENHEFNKTDESGELKKSVFLKRVKNCVIAFDDLLIKEKAWNGFIENTCLICGDEFDDAEIHKSATGHNLKLIQSKVKLESDNFITRKIDDTNHQCLTCNTVVLPSEMMTHFDESEHTKLYIQCRKDKRAIIKITKTENEFVEDKNTKETDFVISSIDAVKAEKDKKNKEQKFIRSETEQNEILDNSKVIKAKKGSEPVETIAGKHLTDNKTEPSFGETDKEIPKPELCNEFSVDVKSVLELQDDVVDHHFNKTDFKTSEETKKFETVNTKKAEPSHKAATVYDEIDILTFTKQHEITYNANHNFAFCRICEKKVPSTMKSMHEHVKGISHQLKNKTCKKNKPSQEKPESSLYRTKPLKEYVKELAIVEKIFLPVIDAVINDKICISFMSYALIRRMDDRFRCQVCEQSFNANEIDEHKDSWRHKEALKTTKVLYTLDSEFVREIRAGLFHCGFCNLIEAGYDSLQQHLHSTAHARNKTSAEWRLEQHMPYLRVHKARTLQEREFDVFMRMFFGGHRF